MAAFFVVFLETVKFLYFAPFELSGRAPFKLVTPLARF